MVITSLGQFGRFLRERQRWVLLALLVGLHLTLLAGAGTLVGMMCWLVDVGFFILWQPFVQAERKVDNSALLWLTLVLVSGIALFGWWLLILWTSLLAALLGGRVLLQSHRPTRIFYLLAFAYLLFALLVFLVPKVVPSAALIGPTLDRQFAWVAPSILVIMLLLPRPREMPLSNTGLVDFFYSVFLFLLIAVLVLGSLAFMLLRQSLYIDAVFRTLVSIAAILLLLAWAWNPRPGFSGLGVHLSRYLLTVGLPFETWLQRLMSCAESENDPELFLEKAFERMLELPWVIGGGWQPAAGSVASSGHFGRFDDSSSFRQDFPGQPLVLFIHTQHKLSPSLIWLFHLLARLTNEYYITKLRARELQQVSYLRAVHETGARLTHDIKNLLQSLNNLCYMAQLPGDSHEHAPLEMIQRQLPQITSRLQQTLEKLQLPKPEADELPATLPAPIWWQALKQRYAQDAIEFCPADIVEDVSLPVALFDSVADNLLHNVLFKRQNEAGLTVRVTLAGDASTFSVCDNGSAVRPPIAQALTRTPVPSESGLGIGLFHAARQADSAGYVLHLASNTSGQVCFELKKA